MKGSPAKNLFTCFIISATVNGCCYFDQPPRGIPPKEGMNIVEIPENTKEFNRTSGTNQMITSLLMWGLPELKSKTDKPAFRLIMESADPNDDSLTEKVWRELIAENAISPMTGNDLFKADFILKSRTTRPKKDNNLKIWKIEILSADGKTVYWEKVILFR